MAEGAAQQSWMDFQAAIHNEFTFTPVHRHVSIEAFRLLADFATDELFAAAKEYVERHAPSKIRRTVKDLVAELIASKKAGGKSAITVRNYHMYLMRFAREFGDRDCASFDTIELERWLDEKKSTLSIA